MANALTWPVTKPKIVAMRNVGVLFVSIHTRRVHQYPAKLFGIIKDVAPRTFYFWFKFKSTLYPVDVCVCVNSQPLQPKVIYSGLSFLNLALYIAERPQPYKNLIKSRLESLKD